MKRIKILISLGIVAILVLSLMPMTSALANTRDLVVVDESGFYSLTDCGFTISVQSFGSAYLAFHYNADNTLTKVVWTTNGSRYEIWTGPNGKTGTVKYMGPGIITFYPNGQATMKVLGPEGVMNLPGYGHVLGMAGQVVFDWNTGQVYKTVGMTSAPNWDAICAYFSS